jgi:hypothetical protein
MLFVMPWNELLRLTLRAVLVLATAMLLACLPIFRGAVQPEDRAWLMTIAGMLAAVLVIDLVARLGMRLWSTRLGRQRFEAGTSRSAPWLICWLALVLSYGWLAALLPRGMVHAATSGVFLYANPLLGGFGTVQQEASLAAMQLYSMVAVMLLAAWQCGRRSRGRRLLGGAVALAGTLAGYAGSAQKLGLPMPDIWAVERVPGNVFGFFWYHANAASFLLLTLPVTVWALRSAILERRAQVGRLLLLVAVTVQVCGLLLNYSKVGHMLLLLQAGAAACHTAVQLRRSRGQSPLSLERTLIITVPLAALIIVLAWVNASQIVGKRWDNFAERGYRDEGRVRAAAISWRMAADAPFGWGPGTFEAVFAQYSVAEPSLNRNRWKHAHHDYGQLAAEWGWCGGLILVSGPLMALWRMVAVKGGKRGGPSMRSGAFYPGLALGCLLLHAWVDFPLQNPVILILAAAVVGLWLTTFEDSGGLQQRSSSRRRRPEVAFFRSRGRDSQGFTDI